MKVRTDFVTNSSSASYVIDFQLKNDSGQTASFTIKTSDIGTSCVVSDSRDEFKAEDHAKELELSTPSERDGDVYFRLYGKPLSKITSLEDLIVELLGLASGHLYGGDWVGTCDFMPSAVETLARSCVRRGITLDNLRIIGGKIAVMPWGDSLYEVDEYIDQWGINVRKGQLKRTGRVYWRGLNTPNWNLGWRDTAWWPLESARRLVTRAVDALPRLTGDRKATQSTSPDPEGAKEVETTERKGIRLPILGQSISPESERMWDMVGRQNDQESMDLSDLDTSQITDMGCLFEDCRNLKSLDLTGFDTSRVTNMARMFFWCASLESLDLSHLDTSQVTNMSFMFCHCESLESLDLTSFDTSRVVQTGCMFGACKSLVSLDLSGFDTSHVESMASMFEGCRNLASLDLSSFDTSRVTEMSAMFRGCESLERWAVPASWPMQLDGAIPDPTNENGTWWSERDGRWMTVDEIRDRGPVADTFTSTR